MHQFLPISSSEITIQHRRPSLFMLLLLKEHLFYINWISFRFSYAISLKSHTVCICFSLFQFDVCRMPMHERATELLKFRCANSMFRLLHWKFEDGILFCWKKKKEKKLFMVYHQHGLCGKGAYILVVYHCRQTMNYVRIIMKIVMRLYVHREFYLKFKKKEGRTVDNS